MGELGDVSLHDLTGSARSEVGGTAKPHGKTYRHEVRPLVRPHDARESIIISPLRTDGLRRTGQRWTARTHMRTIFYAV